MTDKPMSCETHKYVVVNIGVVVLIDKGLRV